MVKMPAFASCLQGVFTVDHEVGLTLVEIADGVTVQDIVESTGCEFQVEGLYSPGVRSIYAVRVANR